MTSTFADFTFYRDEYKGTLSEDRYNASVVEANAEILSQTFSRAKNAPESMREAVKLCECALVDIIDSYKAANGVLPKGISSISNDGLSVSRSGYASENARYERREKAAVCDRYLTTPENLMCRWL